MTDIRIYDFDFKLLCIMSDVISSSWHMKYNGIGTYEGHFRLNDRISDIILNTPYIIITEGTKQAICTGKIADRELLVCGRTVNWLLEKRVMPPFKTRDIFGGEYTDTKTIIDYILNTTYINPPLTDENGKFTENTVDSRKKTDNFVIVPYSHTLPLNRHFWRISANTVHDIIYDLTTMMNTGYRLNFNIKSKTWDFEILKGLEKNIIISQDNRNLYDTSYTEDISNYASGGWYQTSTLLEDSSSEQEAAWKYISYNDNNTGMKYWETVLSGIDISEAESSLKSKKAEYIINGTISQLKYEKDYNLGDIVNVYIRLGSYTKKMRCLITGVNLWYNETSSGEEPIFKQLEEE